MDKFPLELKVVYFTRTVVVAIPEHKADNVERHNLAPENSIDVKPIDDKENTYGIAMRTIWNPDSNPLYPYMIDMECIAIFSVDSKLSHDEAIKGVTITGHNVVFGAIREAVNWITGRHPHGALTLGLSVLTKPKPSESDEVEANAVKT